MKQTKKLTKRRAKRVPVAFNIDVDIDVAGAFTYVLAGSTTPAKSIRPNNGDTVSWRVRLAGLPVPFQVEFDVFNPFGPGKGVIRSLFGRSDPVTVNLPNGYNGNLVFQYRVSTVNGWSDDPDIQPVPSDGIIFPNVVPPTTILLSIVNGVLTLSSPDLSLPAGEFEWKWSGPAIDDFNLTFDPKVSPWPTSTDSAEQRIALRLKVPTTAGKHPYVIETKTTNQEVSGKIEIT